MSEHQEQQEELIQNFKYNFLALLGLLFGVLSFFAFNTIFAPLGLAIAITSYVISQSSWSIPAIILTTFATFFMIMQTLSGGYLLSH